MRLVPKNLRNYLQTPTLIGCKFLTITEATLRLLRSARCDQRSLVVYHGFLSTVKLFSLSSSSTSSPLSQPAAESVSAKPSIMHRLFNQRQLRRSFFIPTNSQSAPKNPSHQTPCSDFQSSPRLCTVFSTSSKDEETFCRMA